MSSRTTKLHSAISPSMNDQWSGKTLRICFFVDRGEAGAVVGPGRRRRRPATASWPLAAVALVWRPCGVVLIHPRSQKLGPTGSSKSLWATRYPSRRPRSAAGGALGRPGRRSPCRCRRGRTSTGGRGTAGGASAARTARSGSPTWVQILEKQRMPLTSQFSRPWAGVMSSGCIRTRITAALAFALAGRRLRLAARRRSRLEERRPARR